MITRVRTVEVRVVETFVGLPEGDGCFWSDGAFAEWLNANSVLAGAGAEWQDYERLESDFDYIAVYAARPCHIDQATSLARYFLEGPFAGECYGVKSPDAVDGWGQLFIISSDSTKSRHDDWTDSIGDLWRMLREGSPVRKTDRSGPGTKDTRAVEGLRCDLWVAFR
jgi:hypothetical protein